MDWRLLGYREASKDMCQEIVTWIDEGKTLDWIRGALTVRYDAVTDRLEAMK